MLKVQEQLRQYGQKHLEDTLSLKFNHYEDGRVIINYDQIKSPKTNDVVKECRGLVLDSDWNLVARSFPRFFNFGEVDDGFDWNTAKFTTKEDGSLILLYYWNGDWHVNTRNSFGSGDMVAGMNMTWRDMVLSLINTNKLDKELCHVLELCTPYNKVVRRYDKPSIFLLTGFIILKSGESPEINFSSTEAVARCVGIPSVQAHDFSSAHSVQDYLNQIGKTDPTFEGFVGRDVDNNRLKVKSGTYLCLHRLSNNGNINSIKNIIPLVLAGEVSEVGVYFPEILPFALDMKEKMDIIKGEVDNLWFCYHDEKSQKRFAMAVKDHRASSTLFQARKLGGHPFDYMDADFWFKMLEK